MVNLKMLFSKSSTMEYPSYIKITTYGFVDKIAKLVICYEYLL